VVDSLLSQHPDKKGKNGQEKRGEKRAEKKKKGIAQKQNRRQERTETQKKRRKTSQSRSITVGIFCSHFPRISVSFVKLGRYTGGYRIYLLLFTTTWPGSVRIRQFPIPILPHLPHSPGHDGLQTALQLSVAVKYIFLGFILASPSMSSA
jgi:hypothetical protein